jgi:RimJ/RimL family protein N-acetyltransferase
VAHRPASAGPTAHSALAGRRVTLPGPLNLNVNFSTILSLLMESDTVTVRTLTSSDAIAFQRVRLRAIKTSPTSAWPTLDEQSAWSLEEVEAKIQTTSTQAVFGVFAGADLVGIAGLRRERLLQVQHKGLVWGVFIDPNFRGVGLAHRLLETIISYAKSEWELIQINLCVNTQNAPAMRLYESIGFVAFGIEPKAMKVGNVFLDEQHMTLAL